jgi:hypothetical protein
VAPVAPIDVIVMTMPAAWPVWSFSLESSRMSAEAEESSMPKFEAGLVIHAWTSEVMSTVTNWPAVEALKLVTGAPVAGMVA